MEFLELAKARYSVRKFSDKPIEEEKINKILEAGRLAPTAKNEQPQKIFVLKSDEAIRKIRENTSNTYNAPIVFLICYDKNKCWKNPDTGFESGIMDASIVCTSMMMEATDLLLGSIWILRFDKDLVKRQFELPENIVPCCLLPIGYAAECCEPSERHFERKDLKDTVIEL